LPAPQSQLRAKSTLIRQINIVYDVCRQRITSLASAGGDGCGEYLNTAMKKNSAIWGS